MNNHAAMTVNNLGVKEMQGAEESPRAEKFHVVEEIQGEVRVL